MTRNRSNRGRSRRGRGRPGDPNQPLEGQPQPAEAIEAPPQPPRPQPAEGQAPTRPAEGQRGARERQRPPQGDPGQPRGGPQRTGRRRQQRRPQVVPIPGNVLRRNAPITGDTGPIVKRSMLAESTPGEPVLGCPMLTRTHIGLPVHGGRPAPRCSLAWAIHSEDEVRFCLETPDHTQCWKAHPERIEEIRERLSELTGD